MFNDDSIMPAQDATPPAEGASPRTSDAGASSPAPSAAAPTQPAPGSGDAFADLSLEQVKLALRRVKDPDLNLNIVDLGLVYDVRLVGKDVEVDMSLTSPGCPSGPEIMSDAERILKAVPGVGEVTINLVWTPFWSPDRIEPRVRAYMGL
jgi:metal-sulfur cluster biosynthetic enzyme